jgi:hypothetical protein
MRPAARHRAYCPALRHYCADGKWLRRFQQCGPSGLLPHSRTRHQQPHKTPAAREAELVELRKTLPTFGARRLIREFDLTPWRVAAPPDDFGWPILSAICAERVGLFSCFLLIRLVGPPRNPFNPQPLIYHLTNSHVCGTLQLRF